MFARLYNKLMERFRFWNAATSNHDTQWRSTPVTPEKADSGARTKIASRAQDLERNSEITNSIISAYVRNVVGSGISPQVSLEDESLNNKIEEEFDKWAQSECDVSGHDSFYELQELVLRRLIVDGEIFVLLHNFDNSLKLQLIEYYRIPEYLTEKNNGKTQVVAGIEIDNYLKPIKYFVSESEDTVLSGGFGKCKEVQAKNMIHVFKRIRPGQIRGISPLAPIMSRMHDIDEYLNSELMAARVSACFSAFITSDKDISFGRKENIEHGNNVDSLYPGMITRLQSGEKIEFANPTRPNSAGIYFTEAQMRMISAAQGLSYEIVSRDLAKASYSSTRAGNLEDRIAFRNYQNFLIRKLCTPIWERFITSMYLSKRLNFESIKQVEEAKRRVHWNPPGWNWVDPKKEVEASILAISNGLDTLENVYGARGKDWKECLDQIAREKQYAESLGLNIFSQSSNKKNDESGKEDDE